MQHKHAKMFTAVTMAASLGLCPVSAFASDAMLNAGAVSEAALLESQDAAASLVYEKEKNEQQEQADTVEINKTLFGDMNSAADIDWHKVEVPYDGSLEISIETDEAKVSLSDWRVVLFRPDNSVVVPDGYSFANRKMTYRASSVVAGTYYIRISLDPSSYTNGAYYFLSPSLVGVDFAKADVTVSDAVYDGTPQTPAVNVKYGDDVLTEGTDYTLEYADNDAAGTGKVKVKGTGMFDGLVEKTFNIAAPASGAGSQSGEGGPNGSGTGSDSSSGTGSETGSGTGSGTGSDGSANSGSANASSSSASKIAMYRVYNPNSGEHFYTASASERNHLVSVGWRDEGLAWQAPSTGEAVYRLYNPNAGDHHYTMSSSERDVLVDLGWRYEGVGWRSTDRTGVAVYRQYNPNALTGNHNYTTSIVENDYLVSLGWRGEGVGWYGLR